MDQERMLVCQEKQVGPYEGMNITRVTGLTAAQLVTLKALGAVADE
ncbi:hypothetical protein [Nostoc favosum]|nr:hypothetical protein [Nostoc favosum]